MNERTENYDHKCKWLIDEVCCNADERNMLADFPAKEYCEKCKLFEKEELPE